VTFIIFFLPHPALRQGNEESLFANLAKKYNIDPSVFGISDNGRSVDPTGTNSGFAQPKNSGFGFGQPQAHSTVEFGHPSALGMSASGFGQPSQFGMSAPGFGQTSQLGHSASGFGQPSRLENSSPGFGQNSTVGTNAIGGSLKPLASPVFGQNSGSGGFGALAKSPSAGFAAFGSPSQAPSPFSSSTPFGAPRR
jgi:nucleoporin NUP42